LFGFEARFRGEGRKGGEERRQEGRKGIIQTWTLSKLSEQVMS
jgi:hypothetical protein